LKESLIKEEKNTRVLLRSQYQAPTGPKRQKENWERKRKGSCNKRASVRDRPEKNAGRARHVTRSETKEEQGRIRRGEKDKKASNRNDGD